MSHLDGRVFTRLQQYAALPASVQSEAERLEQYLTSIQSDLFDSHRTLSLKSVHGIRARPLLEHIETWVKKSGQQEAAADHHVANASAAHIMPVVPPVSDPTAGAYIPHARMLLDALILKGFVTPYKEDKPDETPSAAAEELEIKNTDLLAAVGKSVTVPKNGAPTVWDLVDGAVFAGMLKRKAGLLESITHGKDVYVMVNARLKNIALFASDLGREPLLQLEADSLKVALDDSHYANGVKLWNETGDTELFNAASSHESDALVHALVAVGATQDTQNVVHHESATEKLRREVKEHLGGDRSSDDESHDATTASAQDSSQPMQLPQIEQDKVQAP